MVRGTEGAVGQLSQGPTKQLYVAPSTCAHRLGWERGEAFRKKTEHRVPGAHGEVFTFNDMGVKGQGLGVRRVT